MVHSVDSFRKSNLIGVACLCTGLLLTGHREAKALTIKESVEQTLSTNPEVLESKKKVDAAQQRVKQAVAKYFPSVDVSFGIGPEMTDNASTRGRGLSKEDLVRKESGIAINQTLFDGFLTTNTVEQAKEQLKSLDYSFQDEKERIAFQAIKVFIETLMQQKLLELIKDNLNLHQHILKKVKLRAESGIAGIDDVHQTESRMALASAKLALRQAAYENAREMFERVIGTLPEDLVRPSARLDLLPSSKVESVEKAKQGHYGLLSAQSELESAKFNQQIAKSGYFPKITFELGANSNQDAAGALDESNTMTAMLRMKYNLFNGGGDAARDAETSDRTQQAREQFEKKLREVVESVKISWNDISLSQKRLEFLKNHTKKSQNVTSDYHNQFKYGKRSLLDVLNAENELFDARSAYITEQHTLIRNVYQLMLSMGQLQNSLHFPNPPKDGFSDSMEGIETGDSFQADEILPATDRLSESYAEYNKNESLQRLQSEHQINARDVTVFGHDGSETQNTLPNKNTGTVSPERFMSPSIGGLTPTDVLFIKGVLERLLGPYQPPQASVEQSQLPKTPVGSTVNSDRRQQKPDPDSHELAGPDMKWLRDIPKLPEIKLDEISNAIDNKAPDPNKELSDQVVEYSQTGKNKENNKKSSSTNSQYMVDLGTYDARQYKNLEKLISYIKNKKIAISEIFRKDFGKKSYDLSCGPFPNAAEAADFVSTIREQFNVSAIMFIRSPSK